MTFPFASLSIEEIAVWAKDAYELAKLDCPLAAPLYFNAYQSAKNAVAFGMSGSAVGHVQLLKMLEQAEYACSQQVPLGPTLEPPKRPVAKKPNGVPAGTKPIIKPAGVIPPATTGMPGWLAWGGIALVVWYFLKKKR